MRTLLSLRGKSSILPLLSVATLFRLINTPLDIIDHADLSGMEIGLPTSRTQSHDSPKNGFRGRANEDGLPSAVTRKKKRLLVISAAPKDQRHLLALWSELECFTEDVDKVIISAPKRRKDIIGRVVSLAKEAIPKFSSGGVALKAEFYVNDRYDVGLWCDVLENRYNLDDFDEVGLLNDSIFALRKFSGVLDALDDRNISMSSLSYSYSSPHFKSYGPENLWLESVFRGFDRAGIQNFMDYSCVPVTHPFFCKNEKDWKACIITNFEQGMSRQFSPDQVGGLFPSDVPFEMITQERWLFRSWIQDVPFWRKLVDTMGFPAAKVIVRDGSNGALVRGVHDPLLRNCTSYLNSRVLNEFNNYAHLGKPIM